MLKQRKENNSKGRKSQLIIVGSLLIILGISFVGGKYLYKYLLDRNEDIKIEEFYEKQEEISETSDSNETTEEIKTEEKLKTPKQTM